MVGSEVSDKSESGGWGKGWSKSPALHGYLISCMYIPEVEVKIKGTYSRLGKFWTEATVDWIL